MITPPPDRHWRPPDRNRMRLYSMQAGSIALLFAIGYGGTNWLAMHRTGAYRLYLPWERSIPLVPAMIIPYLSIDLLFVLPLFRLSAVELRQLGRQMRRATLAAAALFLAVPTTLGFARQVPTGWFAPPFRAVLAIDLPGNCVPSLHVAYAGLVVSALTSGTGWQWRAGLGVWLALIVISTVLVHQHQLLDVIGGLALAAATRTLTRGTP